MLHRAAAVLVCTLLIPTAASAQVVADPAMPPPLWDTQVGASFVGTSGNSDTATIGADFALHRRWPTGTIESTATAVWTSTDNVQTAERYFGMVRAQRNLTTLLSLSTGERLERDRFAGINLRSVLDGGVGWALVRGTEWQLDGVTSVAWTHLAPIESGRPDGNIRNTAGGVLQLASSVALGASSTTTQRFTVYPAFRHGAGYRAETEVTVQAALNSRLALKFGYLLRYASQPVAGFKRTDQTTTASIVVQWKSDELAPVR